MRQDGGRNPHVVVDDIFLGKSGGRIENLIKIRQLEMLALNFDELSRSRDLRAAIVPESVLACKIQLCS